MDELHAEVSLSIPSFPTPELPLYSLPNGTLWGLDGTFSSYSVDDSFQRYFVETSIAVLKLKYLVYGCLSLLLSHHGHSIQPKSFLENSES